ncbi:B3/4 domain-containing protein [Facklamia sp. DSM 111018]|uniref:B3/4 domain-containing protein n=1 Tax=Facklamia lactis TaxID=2749967 RepID=A0ABS0LPT2_9LACT|nr:B3/4 domain-containing protein [Facklamia lactis]MBG9986165.1 B3/4 domain-containing protein [Facklamia lactis]
MKITAKEDFWNLFPEAAIGIIHAQNVDNQHNSQEIQDLLELAHDKAKVFITHEEFSKNEVVDNWRQAFRKFKTKKGARSSIEALLKRVQQGKGVGSISPLVDIYNAISLEYGVPCGGEDIATFQGDMQLTLAEGGEEFITYGSDESEPPYPGEVVYKDEAGAICRCWNWRESVRTMLTEQTTDAVFVIEANDASGHDKVKAAIDELAKRLEKYTGAETSCTLLTKENPSYPLN